MPQKKPKIIPLSKSGRPDWVKRIDRKINVIGVVVIIFMMALMYLQVKGA